MGQCGQGNSTGPITKPKKVVGLDGVAIQQISAGTSHSLAWTALPRDRSATSRVNVVVVTYDYNMAFFGDHTVEREVD